MSGEKDLYFIVILGGMNPRIHHPYWYRSVGLLDTEETEQALKTPNTLITPPLAQIHTPNLTIVCQEDRWEIRTTELGQIQKLQEITSKLFDEILPHTPVLAAGFNFHLRRATESQDVGRILAATLYKAPLDLKPDHATGGEAVLRRTHDDHTASVNVQMAPNDKRYVYCLYNFEYRFEGTSGHFSLGDVVTRRFAVDRGEAEEQTNLIVAAINRLERG